MNLQTLLKKNHKLQLKKDSKSNHLLLDDLLDVIKSLKLESKILKEMN